MDIPLVHVRVYELVNEYMYYMLDLNNCYININHNFTLPIKICIIPVAINSVVYPKNVPFVFISPCIKTLREWKRSIIAEMVERLAPSTAVREVTGSILTEGMFSET